MKLYARKMEIQGRKAEVALNILSVLEGPSWTQCEDLDLSELEKEGGLDILLKRLDKQWAHDSKVEMPTHFENFSSRCGAREINRSSNMSQSSTKPCGRSPSTRSNSQKRSLAR